VTWLFLLIVFVVGFGVGAWRAAAPGKSLIRASCELPILLLLITLGLASFLIYAAARGDSFAGLAAASVTLIGVALALVSFIGALFGARFRRAGGRP
jgi:ABC-type sulfate transport system permease component